MIALYLGVSIHLPLYMQFTNFETVTDSRHLISPAPQTGATQINDPLASLPAPANPGGTCQKVNSSGNTTLTLNPGCYSGIQISGNGNLILKPGLYYLTGDFSASGQGGISGSGVMIYMKSGAVSFTGQGNITISPLTSGEYAGMALFVDRGNNKPLSVTGNGGTSMTGTIYAPASQVTVTGNGGTTVINSQILADTVAVTGNGNITVNYNPSNNFQVP